MLGGVAMIETMTFRLLDGVDHAAFLEADARLQSDFAYRQRGIMRRTTAQGSGDRADEWLVVDIWRTGDDADRAAEKWDAHPEAQAFLAFVDRSTIEVRRYAAL